MPYQPHSLFTFSGSFGIASSLQEEWQFGLRTSASTTGEPNQMAAYAGQAAALWQTHLAPLYKNTTALERVRFAAVNELGKVPQTSTGAFLQGDNVLRRPGTATAGQVMPLQTALVVSLETPRAGATGKGRIFLPFPARDLTSNFRLSPTDVAAVLAGVKGLVQGLDALDAYVGGVIVASTKGVSSPVTALRCGEVPDTMRSRRGRLLESYQRVAL